MRALTAAVLLAALAQAAAEAVAAEPEGEYPNKPIRFIVGFAPGGATDIMARALSHKLTERLSSSCSFMPSTRWRVSGLV